MNDGITYATLITGSILLSASLGFKVSSHDFGLSGGYGQIWDRLVLLGVASVLLSLATYGIMLEHTTGMENPSRGVAIVPVLVLFLFSRALWLSDTPRTQQEFDAESLQLQTQISGERNQDRCRELSKSLSKMSRSWAAKRGPMRALLFAPFLAPALLWVPT